MRGEMISVSKAAEMIGVQPNTMKKYMQDPTFPAAKRYPSGRNRFYKSDIETWMGGKAVDERMCEPVIINGKAYLGPEAVAALSTISERGLSALFRAGAIAEPVTINERKYWLKSDVDSANRMAAA